MANIYEIFDAAYCEGNFKEAMLEPNLARDLKKLGGTFNNVRFSLTRHIKNNPSMRAAYQAYVKSKRRENSRDIVRALERLGETNAARRASKTKHDYDFLGLL